MFQAIYEVFGLNPFFSSNMAQFLAGVEDLCSEPYGPFGGMKLYEFFGCIMLGSSIIIYIMQYHIIDKPAVSSWKAWWAFAGGAFVFNVGFSFIRLWTLLSNIPLKFDCEEEFVKVIFNIQDVAMFALVNGILSFIVFTLVSWPKLSRRWSKNCFVTTPIPHK